MFDQAPDFPGAEERNDHHNVPRSRGGSNKRANLSRNDVDRHDEFHGFAGNRTPDLIADLIATNGIGVGGRVIDPSALRDLLYVTNVKDFRTLYDPEAIGRNMTHEDSLRHQAANATFTLAHQTELDLAMQRVLLAINHKGSLPHRLGNFEHRALDFFGERSPRVAIIRLLDEKNKDGESAWVKPMIPRVRREMLRCLSTTEVSYNSATRPDVEDILEEQRKNLARHMTFWKEQIVVSETSRRETPARLLRRWRRGA